MHPGFYVQLTDGNLVHCEMGTDFVIFPRDPDWEGDKAGEGTHGVYATDHDSDDIPLYYGSEGDCREYLAYLPALLNNAGVPVVPTQRVLPSQQPDPEDAQRWGLE